MAVKNPITLRLSGKAEEVYNKYRDQGYKPRQIIEGALLALDGIELEPNIEMSDHALTELQHVVGRLEAIVQSIQQNGGVITSQHKTAIDDALGGKFVNSMSKLVRPGFTKPPSEE